MSLSSAFNPIARLRGRAHVLANAEDKVKNEITACVEEIHDILEHKSKRPLSTFLTEVTSYRSILRIYCERGEEHELRAYVAVRQNRRPYLRYIATEILADYAEFAHIEHPAETHGRTQDFKENLTTDEQRLVVLSGRLEHLLHMHPELKSFAAFAEENAREDRLHE